MMNTVVAEPSMNELPGSDEDQVIENGIFKGKTLSKMPAFMQRGFFKKKVIYTKHSMSLRDEDLQ